MADFAVQVEGLSRFIDSMGNAVDELADLSDLDRGAAELVGRFAQPPRRTGRLAGSWKIDTDRDGARLGYDAVYAGVVHFGWPRRNIRAQPWLTRAADQLESQLADLYRQGVQDIVDGVQGI